MSDEQKSAEKIPNRDCFSPDTKAGQYTDWDYAKAYAQLLGEPHRLFTTCIRYLKQQAQLSEGQLDPKHSRQHPLRSLLSSPSFRAVIYYAALAIHPERLKSGEAITPETLITSFSGEELSTVVAIAYLYRKAKKHSDPRVWEGISGEVQIQMEAGALIGKAMPAIGLSKGLMLGALRYVALSLIAKRDPRGYKLYKRKLNEEELLFDVSDEASRWHCNHLQISAALLQSIGFGLGAAKGVMANEYPTEDTDPAQLKNAQSWFAARRWIESLLQTESVPKEFLKHEQFTLPASEISTLQERIDAIYERGSNFDWVDKTKDDLPEKVNASLAIEDQQPSSEENKSDELPADII